MLTAEQYLGAVARRVHTVGGRTQTVPIGPALAAVGLFSESIALTTVNFCVVAAPCPEVTAAALLDFAGRATMHARANVNGVLGLSAASVVIAGLVGARVHPDAVAVATAKPGVQFAAETRLVAVDLTAGALHSFSGRRVWGFALQGAIRLKVRQCLPEPAEVYAELYGAGGPPAPPAVR